MKKVIIIIVAVVVLAVIGVVGVLVYNKTKDNSSSSSSSSAEAKEDPIVGKWKNSSFGYDFVYTFNSNGTGNYNAAGTNMPFTYKIDGNKISILYDGNTESFDTEFEIKGDTLNVKDSRGEDTFYTKEN